MIWGGLILALLLISCGPTPEQLAATATWQVYNRNVSTVIAASQTARAALPTATLTATPAPIALDAALLTQDEVFSILTWEREFNAKDFSDADTFNFYHVYDFCDYNCIDRFWINGEWESALRLLLSRYPTEQTAAETYAKYFFPDPYTKPHTEYSSLGGYTLPKQALVYEYQDITLLAGVRGRVIFLVGIRLPDATPEQRIFYIGEFAEKQYLKLIEYGN